MFKVKPILFAILGIALVMGACKKEDEKKTETPLTIASTYDTSNYQSNITEIVPKTQAFDELVKELKKGRVNGTKLEYDKLIPFLTSYNNTYIWTDMIPYNVSLIMGNNTGWLERAVKASGSTFHPDSANNGVGGTFGGYLFTELGFEPEQMIEKDMFGSYFSKMAIQLLVINEPTLKSVDQALYFIGLTPQFKNSGDSKHGIYADRYLANYIARRDKNDGNGYYSQIKFNFLKLQSAIKAGPQYNKERDEARFAIRSILEKATYATVINYVQSSISNMSQTEMTDAQKAATLHALAESAGFSTGWARMARKKMSDETNQDILYLLQAYPSIFGNPKFFLNDRINQVQFLTQLIQILKTELQFSDADINDFKQNWVAVQNR